jgi:hypothetical protein
MLNNGGYMAETLGSLCDKLTIVKLKQYHCDDDIKAESLKAQTTQLIEEIDVYVADAFCGKIPLERLTFISNKVYKKAGNELNPIPSDTIAHVFAELAVTNCDLWHVQENVYKFEEVPVEQKDYIAKQLAVVNLRRTQCVDMRDKLFAKWIQDNSQ